MSNEKIALLLIAHGSRSETANADLHHLASVLRQRNLHAVVVASFLEIAQPDIPTGALLCVEQGAETVVMLPYFLSAGLHVREDLTAYRTQLAGRFPAVEFRLAEPLGRHPLLAEIILERLDEVLSTTAVGTTTLKRASS